MDHCPTLLREALGKGVLECGTNDGQNNVSFLRMQNALSLTKGRTVLFLGAAISTFKPAQLPMWNEFVKLLWTSCIDVAFPHKELSALSSKKAFTTFFDVNKARVPNYMVTEVIARRLGMDYLNVLEAFEAQRSANGTWTTNSIHRWTARCLASGNIAAVITTNFDDYVERALDDSQAHSYRVTGDHEIDDHEISTRLAGLRHAGAIAQRLVLIVNGAKAFAFVRSLMPQLGNGKLTFLFKLHGSCYDPPSCIDTRLQRSQGLPSFCTDILDTLLKRAVWLVAGFSGSDMNENLNYLRFLSNKQHTRVFWASPPGPYQESAVQQLTKTLDFNESNFTGISHLRMSFLGQRTTSDDEFIAFNSKIAAWAGSLGQNWCRLILADLIVLFQTKADSMIESADAQRLLGEPSIRQDWNPVLSSMDLKYIERQAVAGERCSKLYRSLAAADFDTSSLGASEVENLCDQLTESLHDIRQLQYDFKSQDLRERTKPIHAQAWVISSLSGLAMMLAGEFEASKVAFERSSTLARLVGDDQTNHMIMSVQASVHRELASLSPVFRRESVQQTTNGQMFAFCPSMDNVNAKMNEAGIPPQVYARALLHRSILFTDGMFVLPSTISNSTVFIDEVLFQGELDEVDEPLLHHLILIMPEHLRDRPNKLSSYRQTRHSGFIFEPVNAEHLRVLDAYFDKPIHQDQILYYSESSLTADYASHLQGQVLEHHRPHTVDHLVRHWHHRGRKASAPAIMKHSQSIQDAVHDLVVSFSHLIDQLQGRSPTRSQLYRFADLFEEADNDPRKSLDSFLPGMHEDVSSNLMSARERIISRPWVYGPLCHELFDVPYRANLILTLAARARSTSHVFLEDFDVHSWEHTIKVRMPADGSTFSIRTSTPDVSSRCSALLLSQMPKTALLQARENLADVRTKIAHGQQLTPEDQAVIQAELAACNNGPSEVPQVKVRKLVQLDEKTKAVARTLLQHCIFIVRKGEALDPMYEEAQLSVPGLFALQKGEPRPPLVQRATC